MNDQQLLDGVAMTTSISCEANELVQDYQLSESSGQNEQYPRQGYLREVSFDSSAQPQSSRRLAETVKAYKERSKSQIKYQTGKTSKNANKQWKVLIGLDDNLFEVYFIGLLENTHDMISKIGQVIVTQEYSRLKTYEKELQEAINSIQFGLNEYDRQKKAFQNQIQVLKAQNDHLNLSIIQLYSVIESLEKEINNYLDNSLDPYINTNSKKQLTFQVPFARTFSHSLQEIKTLKQTYSYLQNISPNDLNTFLQDLLKASKDMIQGKYNLSLTQLKDKLPFFRDYQFLHFVTLIEDNMKAAALRIKNKDLKIYENFPINQGSRKNILQNFLNSLSNNRQILLKNLADHLEPNLYLWHIVSSSLITFLGILCEQSKYYTLQMSFGNNHRSWVTSFLQEIRILIKESNVNLKRSEEDYLCCLEQFVSDVSQLAALRMWSNS